LHIVNDTTISGTSKTIRLSGLSPDTTYLISLKSTNIDSLSSTTLPISITTSPMTIPFVKTYPELDYSLSSNTVSCKKVGDTTNSLYNVVYTSTVARAKSQFILTTRTMQWDSVVVTLVGLQLVMTMRSGEMTETSWSERIPSKLALKDSNLDKFARPENESMIGLRL
jgi:hypothetical protein